MEYVFRFFVYDRFDLKMLIISAILQIVNAQNCYCICRERRGRYRIFFQIVQKNSFLKPFAQFYIDPVKKQKRSFENEWF